MESLFNLLQPLTDVLFAILSYLHDTFGLPWGWSIVALTVIVRIVLVPLTVKQYKSMRAMQELQPQMKELQEKYKGDRQVLNQKMMEFYQENKVNPFGSCLPLILQMPVFIAIFHMLRQQSVEDGVLLGVSWLWIPDITAFDLPLLLVYVASQFGTSMTMVMRDSTQKMMMYAMPVGIGVIMFIGSFPAGLFIYWFTSNLWTIAQQYITLRLKAGPEVAVATAGGASGGAAGGGGEGLAKSGGTKRKAKGADGAGKPVTEALKKKPSAKGSTKGSKKSPAKGSSKGPKKSSAKGSSKADTGKDKDKSSGKGTRKKGKAKSR